MTLYVPLGDDATLEERAARIRYLVMKADRFEGPLRRLRWQIGKELLAAQRAVIAAGMKWVPWCKENVPRTIQDAQKCMKMAAQRDPETAHEKEKEGRRQRHEKVRNAANDAAPRQGQQFCPKFVIDNTKRNNSLADEAADHLGWVVARWSRFDAEQQAQLEELWDQRHKGSDYNAA